MGFNRFQPTGRVFPEGLRRGATLDLLRNDHGLGGLRGVITGCVVREHGTMIAGFQASLRDAVRSFAGSVG